VNYPLLDAFLTMFWFFLWILWLFLLFKIFGDIFRSDDLGGWGKAGWIVFVILLPFLGVFVYLIARGSSMQQRDVRSMQQHDQAMRAYIRDAAAGQPEGGPAPRSSTDELARLAELKADGHLTEEEFSRAKAKLLG
jgi:hypothetical protein